MPRRIQSRTVFSLTWNVYAGERIVIGAGESFRDDLGIKIREMFQEGAADAHCSICMAVT